MIDFSERRVLTSRRPAERSVRESWKRYFGRDVRQFVALGDAKSHHLTVRISDPHVQFKWKKGEVEDGPRVIGNVTKSPELFSYDTMKGDHRSMERFSFSLRQASSIKITVVVVLAALLAIFLTFVAVLGWRHQLEDWNPGYVSVLIVPVSFAASMLLLRSNTTLGMQVNRRWHVVAAGLFIVPLVLAVTELILLIWHL
jgi:hypothetical protein